jgi:transposase
MEKDELITQLCLEIAELKTENSKLSIENANLKARLNISSDNSGMPPSSDNFAKKLKKRSLSLREKSGKKSGGVVGHEGTTLEMRSTDEIDEQKHLNVDVCPVCNSDDLAAVDAPAERKQIIEIIPATTKIVEQIQAVKKCNTCGHIIRLAGANTLSYGESLKTYAVYLNCEQLIPINRVQSMLTTTCGACPSEGSIVNWINECAKKLQPHIEKIEQALLDSKIKHTDESGCGLKKWLHVLSNNLYTVYALAKRGHARWMPKFTQKDLVVSDCLRNYLGQKFQNVLCNQHIMRDCKRIQDEEPWANKLYKLLQRISRIKNWYANKKDIEKRNIPLQIIEIIKQRYDVILKEGFNHHLNLEHLKGNKKRFGHNLVIRLWKHKASFLRCLHDVDIPFTNNQAERDIRMLKTKNKIGAFRTDIGCEAFSDIRGFISTVKKHNINSLDALLNPDLLKI